MPPPSITLYFDTVSPFAYIAYHVLRVSPPINENATLVMNRVADQNAKKTRLRL